MKTLYLVFLITFSSLAMTQNSGAFASISGHLKDFDTFEPIPFRCVRVYTPYDLPITGTCADFDGNYLLDSIPLGIYSLKIIEDDYELFVLENVRIDAPKQYIFDFILVKKPSSKELRKGKRGFFRRILTRRHSK